MIYTSAISWNISCSNVMVLECNISMVSEKMGPTILVALWILDPWRWNR
jgi:hypothetical protein